MQLFAESPCTTVINDSFSWSWWKNVFPHPPVLEFRNFGISKFRGIWSGGRRKNHKTIQLELTIKAIWSEDKLLNFLEYLIPDLFWNACAHLWVERLLKVMVSDVVCFCVVVCEHHKSDDGWKIFATLDCWMTTTYTTKISEDFWFTLFCFISFPSFVSILIYPFV